MFSENLFQEGGNWDRSQDIASWRSEGKMPNNNLVDNERRGRMTQKVNYSMHFSCYTLILCCNRINSKINDGDDDIFHQGSIDRYINEFYHELISSTMSSSSSSLSATTKWFLCHLLCLPNRALHYICPLNRNQTPIST